MHDEEETGNGIIIRLPLLAFQLVMFLTAFIYSSCVTNLIYIFLLNFQQKFNLILILRTQVCSLRDENAKLKKRIECFQKKEDLCKCKLPIFEQLIKSDSGVHFYTGIPTISTFKHLQQFISPYVRHLWRGAKHTSTKIKRKFKSTPNRLGPKRKLPGDDQFLLMWMKLRLNTPMRDLATRFGISETTCSRIFSSWARASANVLKSFVFSPDQGTINATKPPRFSPVKNLTMIIDCSELFT